MYKIIFLFLCPLTTWASVATPYVGKGYKMERSSYSGHGRYGYIVDSPPEWRWGLKKGMRWVTVLEEFAIQAAHTRYHSLSYQRLDLADLEMRRPVWAWGSFCVKPYGGVRGAWMRKESMDPYLGMGLRGGIDSSWKMTPHILLFGDGALSYLSSGTRPEHPMIAEWALGLKYHHFLGGKTLFTCSLGYEQMDVLQTLSSMHTLNLQGMSLGCRLDF